MTMLVQVAFDDRRAPAAMSLGRAFGRRSRAVAQQPDGRSARRRGVTHLVAQFVVAGAVALVALGVASLVASRQSGTDQAVRDAIDRTGMLATAVFEPHLTDALLAGDQAARDGLAAITSTLGDEAFVHYRIWTTGGTIVHADEPTIVGTHMPIGDDALDAFASGVPRAEVSDLTADENVLERDRGQLLEVYYPVRAQDGTRLLLETYQSMSLVEESAKAIWWQFLPAVLVPLVLLQLVQVPLAVRLARQAHQDRVQMLRSADEATTRERRAIAHDLHDGAVQDLAGVSMSMAALARRVPIGERAEVDQMVTAINGSVESLRSLFTEIYPVDLREVSLRTSLEDLGDRLVAAGVECEVECRYDLDLTLDQRQIVHRVVQEATRNVVRHADARRVVIAVRQSGADLTVSVRDDGCGFEIGPDGPPRPRGHFGMKMLRDLVEAAGGSTVIRSAPGAGTVVEACLPG